MEGFENTVNDVQEVNVEPQSQDTNVQDTGVSNDQMVNSDPATQKPVQDPQTNAYFAEMRRKTEAAEARAAQLERDHEIARQYGQYGIYTEADYQRALAEQEAQSLVQNPNLLYDKLTTLEQKIQGYETREQQLARKEMLMEQEKSLKEDALRGKFFTQWEPEIKNLADQFGTDYKSVFALMLEQRIDSILNNANLQAEQTAIQKITQNAQTSPGALGGGGVEHKTGYSSLSAKEKREIRERVLRGENVDI